MVLRVQLSLDPSDGTVMLWQLWSWLAVRSLHGGLGEPELAGYQLLALNRDEESAWEI